MILPPCAVCHGRGHRLTLHSLPGAPVTLQSEPCPRCLGTGKVETIRSEQVDVEVGTYRCLLCDSDVRIAFDVVTRLCAGELAWSCQREKQHAVAVVPGAPILQYCRNKSSVNCC
jgi:DnaJ-class molecular chaperone